MNTSDLLNQIFNTASKQVDLVRRVVAVTGDSEIMSVNGGTVGFHAGENFAAEYRRLRKAGAAPASGRSIFPDSLEGTDALIVIRTKIAGVPVDVYGRVTDFTRWLKPGAACQVVPQGMVVKCQ